MVVHDKMGKEWGDALAPYLPDDYMEIIRQKIQQERKISEVYPASENIFRAFEMTPLSKVKVVMIAQDPYNSPAGQATGLAFDCGVRISPSMEKMVEILAEDYPEGFFGEVYDGKVSSWAKQGVFLFNSALTVRKSNPQSHLKLWQKFAVTVIDVLKRHQNPKVFVILGNDAKKLVPNVPAPHVAFTYEHPAAASYAERKWNAKGIFKRINSFVMDNYGKEINW